MKNGRCKASNAAWRKSNPLDIFLIDIEVMLSDLMVPRLDRIALRLQLIRIMR